MTSTKSRPGSAWSIRHCSITSERPLDTRLAAVLEGKPSVDAVPIEAWWHLAESLRHSITVRRAREGVAIVESSVLQLAIYQATWSAEAALTHLGAGQSVRLLNRQGQPNVRATISQLARLIVSARATPVETLRGAILDHLAALGESQP